jgi:hypothetical protein
MKDWMGYVYQQQPLPTDLTGVPVQIAVLDSNGNHYPIGTATTDTSGTFSTTWTPTISGNFTVYATFAGTNGYWPSTAVAHFYASEATTPAPTSQPVNLASTQSYILDVGIAIIVVIIIIGAILALLLLRKRP